MKLQLLLLLICFRFGLQSHSAEVHGVDLATATTVWTKITLMNLLRHNAMAAVAINHYLLSMRHAFATLPLVLSFQFMSLDSLEKKSCELSVIYA